MDSRTPAVLTPWSSSQRRYSSKSAPTAPTSSGRRPSTPRPKAMLAATPPRRMARSSTRNESETLSSLSAISWSVNLPGNVIKWSVAIDPVTAMRTVATPRPASVERIAAGAGARRVRVVDREALLLDRVHEVDGRAHQVRGAHLVGHHPDAAELADDVAVDLALVEVELVAKPGAAARLYRDAQLEIVPALLGQERAHLGRRAVGQEDPLHGLLLNSHFKLPPGWCAAFARRWRCSNVQCQRYAVRPHSSHLCGVAQLLSGNPLQTGCAPDGKPPGQILLELQVVADHALDLQLECVVPALAGQRGERVEGTPLVQVDQTEPALIVVPEGDQGAQQLRAEAVVHERGVDRVQVGDQRLELIGHVRADQPVEAVGVFGHLDRQAALLARAQVEQFLHVLLDVGEGPALDRAEADGAGSSGLESGSRVQRDRRRRQREQIVQLGLDRLGPAQQRVEKTHERYPAVRPSCCCTLSSSASLRSRLGWVENTVDRLALAFSFIAGAKKNAFSGSAARRSWVGILFICVLTLTSALFSALGWPVSSAPLRSADSSRYRESILISRKLTA